MPSSPPDGRQPASRIGKGSSYAGSVAFICSIDAAEQQRLLAAAARSTPSALPRFSHTLSRDQQAAARCSPRPTSAQHYNPSSSSSTSGSSSSRISRPPAPQAGSGILQATAVLSTPRRLDARHLTKQPSPGALPRSSSNYNSSAGHTWGTPGCSSTPVFSVVTRGSRQPAPPTKARTTAARTRGGALAAGSLSASPASSTTPCMSLRGARATSASSSGRSSSSGTASAAAGRHGLQDSHHDCATPLARAPAGLPKDKVARVLKFDDVAGFDQQVQDSSSTSGDPDLPQPFQNMHMLDDSSGSGSSAGQHADGAAVELCSEVMGLQDMGGGGNSTTWLSDNSSVEHDLQALTAAASSSCHDRPDQAGRSVEESANEACAALATECPLQDNPVAVVEAAPAPVSAGPEAGQQRVVRPSSRVVVRAAAACTLVLMLVVLAVSVAAASEPAGDNAGDGLALLLLLLPGSGPAALTTGRRFAVADS